MGVQENSTSLVGAPLENSGAMLAGAIGVGGPISLAFSKCACSPWKLTFSQLANFTVSLPFVTSPVPLVIKISCWSPLGSLCTCAADSGARDAVAPATMTCDFDPWLKVAVERSTVPVLTATATFVCC